MLKISPESHVESNNPTMQPSNDEASTLNYRKPVRRRRRSTPIPKSRIPSVLPPRAPDPETAFPSLRIEVNTADRGFRQLKNLISMETEELWVLALDPRKALIEKRMIFRGTVDSCLVHPRDIFRFAYLCNASSLIVAHSHPSGDLLPSEQDILFTQELIRAAKILQLPVVDHLIITPYGYSSFANEGWCRFSNA